MLHPEAFMVMDQAFKENAPVVPSGRLGHYLGSKACSEIMIHNYASFFKWYFRGAGAFFYYNDLFSDYTRDWITHLNFYWADYTFQLLPGVYFCNRIGFWFFTDPDLQSNRCCTFSLFGVISPFSRIIFYDPKNLQGKLQVYSVGYFCCCLSYDYFFFTKY